MYRILSLSLVLSLIHFNLYAATNFRQAILDSNSPQEILKIVEEVSQNKQIEGHELQGIVYEAIQTLYTGKTNFWYPTNNKLSGLDQIEKILNLGLLDVTGKDLVMTWLKSYNPNSKNPKFPMANKDTLSRILRAIHTAPLHPPYKISIAKPQSQKLSPQLLSTKELLAKAGSESKALEFVRGFLDQVKANLYDDAVLKLKENNGAPSEFYGRDLEVDNIVDSLFKMEKGHVLITGKAGVGKTTILKIIMERLLSGEIPLRGEAPPIMVELPITVVTFQNDPSEINRQIKAAQELSLATKRRVIVYVDEAHITSVMTRNALKSFLTEIVGKLENKPRVNLIFSTTSSESRQFLMDSAFSRRFTEVDISEFSKIESIELIEKAYVPRWKKHHSYDAIQFKGIDEKAYEYAYNFRNLEQAHAGNPTGIKELLESAISRKVGLMKSNPGPFTLSVDDVREYLKNKLKLPIMPGDHDFDQKFNMLWSKVMNDMSGGVDSSEEMIDGVFFDVERIMKNHLSSLSPKKMTALMMFGPPGGGKTVLAKKIADVFYNGAIVKMSGADLKTGGMGLAKLTGSVAGTKDSQLQASMITQFVKSHPSGGVILLDEGDYVHPDVVELFTNMITDKSFIDGLGKDFDMSRYVLWINSNIGQEALIPNDPKLKMTWAHVDALRSNATEIVTIEDKKYERMKSNRITAIFEKFMGVVVRNGDQAATSNQILELAQKQTRRYEMLYMLPPTQNRLKKASFLEFERFKKEVLLEKGIQLSMSKADIETLIDLPNMDFKKGFSYVHQQLQDLLTTPVNSKLNELKGKNVTIALQRSKSENKLLLTSDSHESLEIHLPKVSKLILTPWKSNQSMINRVDQFSENVSRTVFGMDQIIEDLSDLYQAKLYDWSVRPVITVLGPSGSGKSNLAEEVAVNLYGDEGAVFKMTNLSTRFDLSNYLRPPVGVGGVNGNQVTEFEHWFLARRDVGGGVIELENYLDFQGLSDTAVSSRLEVLAQLSNFLKTGYIDFAGRREDGRSFTVIISGNSLPANLDSSKLASIGKIYQLEALTKKHLNDILKIEVKAQIENLKNIFGEEKEIKISPKVLEFISGKKFSNGANGPIDTLKLNVFSHLSSLMRAYPEALSFEIKMGGGTGPAPSADLEWFVDGLPVHLSGVSVPGKSILKYKWGRGEPSCAENLKKFLR